MKTLRTEIQLQAEINEQGILELRLPVGFAGQTVQVTLSLAPITTPNDLDTTPSPKPSSYQELVKKARAENPRAYEPWSKHEEKQLQQWSLEGKSIDEIAQLLGRNARAIERRLEKLLVPTGKAVIRTEQGKMYKPAVHSRLVEAARYGEFVGYEEITALAEITHLPRPMAGGMLRHIFFEITMQDWREDPQRPLLCSIVTLASNQPPQAYFDTARKVGRLLENQDEGKFWHAELRTVYNYWQTNIRSY